jgi:hypothetical protein
MVANMTRPEVRPSWQLANKAFSGKVELSFGTGPALHLRQGGTGGQDVAELA